MANLHKILKPQIEKFEVFLEKITNEERGWQENCKRQILKKSFHILKIIYFYAFFPKNSSHEYTFPRLNTHRF